MNQTTWASRDCGWSSSFDPSIHFQVPMAVTGTFNQSVQAS